MAHVTFIHGIGNKPQAAALIRIWREALANASDPLPLGDLGVTSEMVYWADLMYEKPDDLSSYEGVLENTPESVDLRGGSTIQRTTRERFVKLLQSPQVTRPHVDPVFGFDPP